MVIPESPQWTRLAMAFAWKSVNGVLPKDVFSVDGFDMPDTVSIFDNSSGVLVPLREPMSPPRAPVQP